MIMSEPTKLPDDWPSDAECDELLQFAEQLQAALPTLPADALARVEAKMNAEIDRHQRRPYRRVLQWGCSAAAAVLLAILAHWLTKTSEQPGPAIVQQKDARPVFIEDHVTVAVGVGSPPVKKPLLRLE